MALAALLLAGLTLAVAPEGPDHSHLLPGASAAYWLAAFGLFRIEYGRCWRRGQRKGERHAGA